MIQPAPGHVEIEPFKEEGIIISPDSKFEEMGKVIAIADEMYLRFQVGDVIFFDSYACRATPEINGKKHYFVNVMDGGLIAIDHVERK